MPEAWRCFPSEPPGPTPVGLGIYGTLKQWLWYPHYPRCIWSLVTIKIAPPGSREIYMCPPTKGPPDPCAKETVLKALRQFKKERRKLDRPLWFEVLDTKRRRENPESRRSIFKSLGRSGVIFLFVLRPGPLLLVQQCGEDDTAHPPSLPPTLWQGHHQSGLQS